MCELFALFSRISTEVSISLNRFAQRGGLNGHTLDGWGLALYAGNDLRLYREPEPARDSAWLGFMRYRALDEPLYLTIGWFEQDGESKLQHGDDRIRMLLTEKLRAWRRDRVPFHVRFTSPAMEVLDMKWAQNLSRARSAELCVWLIVYPAGDAPPAIRCINRRSLGTTSLSKVVRLFP